jgi:DNA-binding phage protein
MKPAPHTEGHAPSLPYEDWLIERLKDPAEASAYLEAVIHEGGQVAILLALRQVAQARHL